MDNLLILVVSFILKGGLALIPAFIARKKDITSFCGSSAIG